MNRSRSAPDDPAAGRLIRRRRLQRRLDRDWPLPLTLVAAPAGFGKTTAVEAWLGNRRERTVWLALDEDDNDAALLWSRLLAEAGAAYGVGDRARAALRRAVGSPRPAIEALAGELRDAGAPLTFVLDDLHLIEDEACLRTVELGARLLAPQARLVLISRQEPALPLERLHGRGKLLRIGPEELTFERDEVAELLLDRYRIDLDPAAVDAVFTATGGWPAAVYMSALWLRDAADPAAAARGLTGAQDRLTDYLLSEVVGGLDPELRSFLRHSAVLARMSGPLCDEVLGREDSAAMLERLRQTNLLVRADRRHRKLGAGDRGTAVARARAGGLLD